MTTTDVTYGGVALSTAVPEAVVTNVQRDLAGQRRDVFVEVPGRAGSVFYPEAAGDRTVRISVQIVGSSFANRRDAIRRLASWAMSSSVQALSIDDESDRYELAIAASSPQVEEHVTGATAELEFRCGPYSWANTVSDVLHTCASGATVAYAFPDTVAAEPTVEVKLNGGAASTAVTVDGRTLTNAHSFATNDVFVISTPGYVVTTGSIGAGSTADKYLTGWYAVDDVNMTGVSGQFPLLKVGGGSVKVTTNTGVSCDVRIRWRRRYP